MRVGRLRLAEHVEIVGGVLEHAEQRSRAPGGRAGQQSKAHVRSSTIAHVRDPHVVVARARSIDAAAQIHLLVLRQVHGEPQTIDGSPEADLA